VTRKADFNAEQWAQVVEAPALAAAAVIFADRGGTLRETITVAQTYAEARQEGGTDGELLAQVVESPPAVQPDTRDPDELANRAAGRLRAALGVLDGRATEAEIEEYKRFVAVLVDRAARAHKEGGFLGVGGKEVSDAERSAIETITAALGEFRRP
jgi:hypothetical protein